MALRDHEKLRTPAMPQSCLNTGFEQRLIQFWLLPCPIASPARRHHCSRDDGCQPCACPGHPRRTAAGAHPSPLDKRRFSEQSGLNKPDLGLILNSKELFGVLIAEKDQVISRCQVTNVGFDAAGRASDRYKTVDINCGPLQERICYRVCVFDWKTIKPLQLLPSLLQCPRFHVSCCFHGLAARCPKQETQHS